MKGGFEEYLFESCKKGALNGYKDDAKTALSYVISCVKKSDIPENIKNYAIDELVKIINEDDAKFAFYINKKGKGKRPDKKILERNIEIARFVYNHKHYDGDVLRSEILTDEDAIGEVAALDQPLSEETIRDAYYDHKEWVYLEDNYNSKEFL